MADCEITAALRNVPPGEQARQFEQAALLILARKNWRVSPDDRIEIVELTNGYSVNVLGSEGGKPVRYASYHEQRPESAVRLACTIKDALSLRDAASWPIEIVRLGARP